MFYIDASAQTNFSSGYLTIPEVVDFFGSIGFRCIIVADSLYQNVFHSRSLSIFPKASLSEALLPIYFKLLNFESIRSFNKYKMTLIPGVSLILKSKKNRSSHRLVLLGANKKIQFDSIYRDVISESKSKGLKTLLIYQNRACFNYEFFKEKIDLKSDSSIIISKLNFKKNLHSKFLSYVSDIAPFLDSFLGMRNEFYTHNSFYSMDSFNIIDNIWDYHRIS
jgi:hypothetical protein